MHTMTVDWGDVPTWIGAITTTLALLAAGWVVRIEMQRDARAEEDRRRADEDRARSEQAAMVATWPSMQRAGRKAILVRNGSNLPIYNVEVSLRHDDGRTLGLHTEFIVPPGDHWWQYPEQVLKLDELGNGRVDETRRWIPELTFEDSAGRLWQRNEDGQLGRIG